MNCGRFKRPRDTEEEERYNESSEEWKGGKTGEARNVCVCTAAKIVKCIGRVGLAERREKNDTRETAKRRDTRVMRGYKTVNHKNLSSVYVG